MSGAAPGQHYTFGDGDVAALRLRLLAETYAGSSAALLWRLGQVEGGAVDVGCGPGYTTELVARTLRPAWTVGLDRSARLVAEARARLPALRFVEHDVTVGPLPVLSAAVIYSRFLLTHLPDPAAAVRTWAHGLAPGGRLVLEETAALTSEHPGIQRYYDLVEELQAHYGQRFRIGAELGDLARAAGLDVQEAGVALLMLPAPRMATLHALNLRTWGADRFARERFDPAELSRLSATLERIASGEERASPIRSAMGQAVARRT
jgi:SAM-dependent methyltransferase